MFHAVAETMNTSVNTAIEVAVGSVTTGKTANRPTSDRQLTAATQRATAPERGRSLVPLIGRAPPCARTGPAAGSRAP